MQTLAIIGAPSSAGAFGPGQELAPTALRAAGLSDALTERGVEVHDLGDGPFQRWRPDRVSPRAQNIADVIRAVEAATASITGALADHDLVLVLGGDCTVGIAAVRALKESGAAPGLCYLDLDADMNTPTSAVDGALDWMGVGMMLGVDGAQPGIAPPGLLEPSEVVLIGFDEHKATDWEREQISKLGVRVLPVDTVKAEPSAAAGSALTALGDEVTRLAVHFDVDVVDFVDAPLSQDINRNIGLPLETTFAVLRELIGDPRARVLTITELNPHQGAPDGSTLRRLIGGVAQAITDAPARYRRN